MTVLLLLVATTGALCVLQCLRGVRVFDQPDATLLRSRAVLRGVAAAVAAAAIVLLPDWSRVQPAEGFVIHTGYQFDVLAGFFLWLALSGLLSFAASILLLGGLVRPRSVRREAERLDHRAILAGVERAEEAARGNALVEPVTFLVFGLLAVLALFRLDAREVRGDPQRGLRMEGFLPGSVSEVPWADVRAVTLQAGGKPNEREAVWILADGTEWTLRGASLWRLDAETMKQVTQVAESAGIDVERVGG